MPRVKESDAVDVHCISSGYEACRAKHDHGGGNDFTTGTPKKSYAPDLHLEPIHVELHLDVDLANKRCKGNAITTVRANSTRSRSLSLDAVGFFEVKATDADANELDARYDGKQVHVTWAKPFEENEERKVAISYIIENPITGALFSYPDEAYPNRHISMGTDNETERCRFWFPCVDYPIVRPTYQFNITADAKYTIAANGSMLWEKPNEGTVPLTKTACWRLDHPCPSYLVCVCVGDFNVIEDKTNEGVTLSYIAPKTIPLDQIKLTFDQTPKMVSFLVNKVGRPFPFPNYQQIVIPGIGGAMENIGLVTYCDIWLVDELLAKEWKIISDSVVIHEMTHSFFGDSLVCRHFEHSWLKESWATYMEAVWLEDSLSLDDFRYDMYGNAQRYFQECNEYVRPIVTREYDHSWSMFDRHLYPGGSWRIHMLRCQSGDSTFWKGVNRYVTLFEKKLVETEDFKRALEDASHSNLNKFFDQWIYSCGYPKLKGTFSYNGEKGEVMITLEQTQKDEKRWIGLFEIAVDVELIETDSERAPHRATVQIDDVSGKGVVTFSGLQSKPAALRIDPDGKVLFALDMNPGEDILFGTLSRRDAYTDIVNRIWAAQQLIKIGSGSSLAKLNEAIKTEPFYGVRAEVASALGKQKKSAGIDILTSLLSSETDARAFAQILSAHSSLRDPRLRESIIKFLDREEAVPYRAQWYGLQALAEHRVAEDIARFEKAALTPQRWVSAGGIRALGKLRYLNPTDEENVLSKLIKYVEYGNSSILERVRSSAVWALADFASQLKKRRKGQVIEIISDLLALDPYSDIKVMVVNSLVLLQAKSALPLITASKSQFAEQYHPWFERKLRDLSKDGDSETVQKLQKQVEDLESRIRSIEDVRTKDA